MKVQNETDQVLDRPYAPSHAPNIIQTHLEQYLRKGNPNYGTLKAHALKQAGQDEINWYGINLVMVNLPARASCLAVCLLCTEPSWLLAPESF